MTLTKPFSSLYIAFNLVIGLLCFQAPAVSADNLDEPFMWGLVGYHMPFDSYKLTEDDIKTISRRLQRTVLSGSVLILRGGTSNP